ncbi:hypothetical protein [Cellvibrio sp. pealriver]|uniref:hypothetical protein n=1 Tax=Cellvibrio sp. pealriver TaxID=1622269 RepID=UPI00066FCD15|nr:hypothetical protein [Cellvibrio sp. pealriver]
MNNGAVFEELLLYLFIFLLLLFPFMYIFLKKGKNKFLFCSSCIGAMAIVFCAIYAFALPFAIVFIKVIPQLAEYGHIENILPILRFAEFIQTYHFIVLFPLLYVALPILIFRRYNLFKNKI